MIELKIKDEIQSSVLKLFGAHLKTDDINIEKPADSRNGDLSTNIAFMLAKKLGNNPAEISEKVTADLSGLSYFKEVKSAGGFINFYLNSKIFQEKLAQILKEGDNYGKNELFSGQKIQIEFISANPTGPLTIAIGRGGFGGDVLSNLFQFSGADVTREYYVNDSGNQIKILGFSVLVSAHLAKPEGDFYRGEYIDDWTTKNLDFIKKNKNDVFAIGSKFAEVIVKEYLKPGVASMKIKFDTWFSEKSLYDHKLIEKTLKHLKKEKLTYEKDGAVWLSTSKFGDDKDRVVVKSNGEYTYVMPDIAYHWEKFSARKFDKVIDIVGADHHGYTERMLAGVASLGYEKNLTYILTQMVKLQKDGKEYRLSKRKGVVVTIGDLLTLIGGSESEASDVARFFFLSRSFNTPMLFDLDLARERTEKNPVFYVKYAFARIHGILTNAQGVIPTDRDEKAGSDLSLSLLTEPAELNLIEKLAELPMTVQTILTTGDYPVHLLTFYALDLAKKFHYFYDQCRVIDEENPKLTQARLELIRATKVVLLIVGEKLLGLSMPEKM